MDETPPTLPSDVVPLLPMRNLVLFPHAIAPITVGRPKSVAALRHATESGGSVGIVLQRDATEDDPGRDALYDIGTLAQIVRHAAAGETQEHAMCRGEQRIRLVEWVEGWPFLAARIERLEGAPAKSPEAEALVLQLHQRAAEMLTLLPGVPAEVAQALQTLDSPAQLADVIASLLDIEPADKQQLLEALRVEDRPESPPRAAGAEHPGAAAVEGDRRTHQGEDRRSAAQVPASRAAENHPQGARQDTAASEEIDRLGEAIAKAAMHEDIEKHVRGGSGCTVGIVGPGRHDDPPVCVRARS